MLEGVAFAFRDCLDALDQAGADGRQRLIAVGGGSRSQLLAADHRHRRSALPIDVPADGDFGAAFGAARLGLIAADRRRSLRGLRAAEDPRDHRADQRDLDGSLSPPPTRPTATLYPAIKEAMPR